MALEVEILEYWREMKITATLGDEKMFMAVMMEGLAISRKF